MRRKSRAPRIVGAQGLACYLAARNLGYRTSDVAEWLGMTPAGVSMAARRGAHAVDPERAQHVLES